MAQCEHSRENVTLLTAGPDMCNYVLYSERTFMKHVLNILFVAITLTATGQQDNMSREWMDRLFNDPNVSTLNYKDSLKNYDFGRLWLKTDNQNVFGFIGSNFERIKMKLISVEKDSVSNEIYHVFGKSMVKNTICNFNGTIILERISISKELSAEYNSRDIKYQGFLTAKYRFEEDSTQNQSGIFEGTLISLWFIDTNNQVQYDDIILGADAFRNNQFAGIWKGYSNGKSLVCNWGDYRILNCGDLDIGAGLFSPSDAHLQFGWQSYRDAYFNNDKDAIEIEKRKWWN